MDVEKVKQAWNKICEQLSTTVPEHIIGTWIVPLHAVEIENFNITLLSPHQLAVNILNKSWSDEIKKAVRDVLGSEYTYTLKYDPDIADEYIKTRKKQVSKQISGLTPEEEKKEQERKAAVQMQSGANLNLNHKFENFVVGDNSKFAYNAAFSVANNPAKKFNPLFIYGASGLGKTHLLQAIGHYILFNTKLKVRYIRMEEYFNEWVKCFQYSENANSKGKRNCNNTLMRKFHQKFENIDILLMDDIQFIESKMKTMEDFFSTFEALYTNNKQIVIASDREPKDIPKLDNRLRTRFEMGLVVDIAPPDYETRFEIVKSYAKEIGAEAQDDVYQYVSENFTDNVRELKGAYNKVTAFAEFTNSGITLETAKKALRCDENKKRLTIDIIAQKTAQYFDLSVKDLKSTARQQSIAQARHIAIYLAREVLKMSYESIGEFFSKKHTTVMYSCDLVEEKLSKDSQLESAVNNIRSTLRS